MRAIYALWWRELTKFSRSRVQIVSSLAQRLLYLIVLGFGLEPVFHAAGRGSYLQFVAPGVIGMTVLFTSFFFGVSLLFDRQFGFLKETLVAPVPRIYLMIGRTLGGATVALFEGILILIACFIVGFRPTSVFSLPLGLLFMLLIAIVFVALGLAIGAGLQDMQGYQLIISFLVMPTFFLSGALFPLEGLPQALAILTKCDPLSYGVDGLRATLIGSTQFGVMWDLLVLTVLACATLCAGAWRFSAIEV